MSTEDTAKELVQNLENGLTIPGDAVWAAEYLVDCVIQAIGECGVVAGYPLDEWKEVKDHISKM